MSGSEQFFPLGVVPIAFDTPCFGTPIFRNESGQRYFLQNVQKRRNISGFQFIGDVSQDRYIPISPNQSASIGDRLLVGFRFVDGTALIGTKGEILKILIEREREFRPYPFFYLYLARHTHDEEMVRLALENREVRLAVNNKWVAMPRDFSAIAGTAWTKQEVSILEEALKQNISVATIARKLGRSRNSVTSKMARMKLIGNTK